MPPLRHIRIYTFVHMTLTSDLENFFSNASGSAFYILTRTRFRKPGFYSSPAAWNTLPSDLHNITDTGKFRKWLKSVPFKSCL